MTRSRSRFLSLFLSRLPYLAVSVLADGVGLTLATSPCQLESSFPSSRESKGTSCEYVSRSDDLRFRRESRRQMAIHRMASRETPDARTFQELHNYDADIFHLRHLRARVADRRSPRFIFRLSRFILFSKFQTIRAYARKENASNMMCASRGLL